MNAQEIIALNNKIQETILALPKEKFQEVVEKVRAESIEQGLAIYDEDKKPHAVEIKLKPWFVTAAQERYMRRLSHILRKSLNRIISHYFEDTLIKDTLPLTEPEDEWFRLVYPKGIPREQAVFERFDTNAAFSVPGWKDFKFIEFNSVGIGCIHFAPVANYIAKRLILPILKDGVSGVVFKDTPDYREVLIGDIMAHARAIDRPRANIAFVERRECIPGGADELTFLSEYCNKRGL